MSGLANTFDLRKEEDVKEYLKTLGTEYRFQCYSEKRPDGCHRLADYMESFKKDFEKARMVYKHNCEENKYGHSCFKMGNYFFLGKGGQKDTSLARDYYLKGCDAKFPAACYNAGQYYLDKKLNGKKDFDKAFPFIEKACDLKDHQSCHKLTAFYIKGDEGLQKDMEKAFKFASKTCDMGYPPGCANVSIMYKRGEGVEKNLELSEKYKKKATDLHAEHTEIRRQLTFSD